MNGAGEYIGKAQHMLAGFDLGEVRASGILPGQGQDFFPVVNYPPTIMVESEGAGSENPAAQISAPRPLTGYLHIPFCPSRCTYCHWITKTGSGEDDVDVYLRYLVREMQLHRQAIGGRIPLQSVLWGGGTPTYPSAGQMETLLLAYHECFDLDQCTQFSVEAEPGTLVGAEGLARLKVMKDYGVDRISLGVQSFDDNILRRMGRAHNHAESLEALDNIRKAGFENSYIDLIYGYPGQTVDQWSQQLQQAVQLDIDGYQIFRLRIKPTGARKGAIMRIKEKSPNAFHSADEVYLMKALGKIVSEENGFYEYQRRIFSRQGQSSSHYLRDWFLNLYDILGVGVSAWSQLQGRFTVNISDMDLTKYYGLLEQGKLPVKQRKWQTLDDFARRSFILPLKNDFVDKQAYRQAVQLDAGEVFAEPIAAMKDIGMIEETEDVYRLSARGQFFADEVCTQFFAPQYQPFQDVSLPVTEIVRQNPMCSRDAAETG